MRIACILIFLITMAAFGAEKTDVLVLRNGDHLTGEIKALERGRLKFKTDATDTIRIEWDDIATLISKQTLQFELTSSERFTGTLEPSARDGMLIITTPDGRRELPFDEVVYMIPIEAVFWERVDGYISTGASANRTNGLNQFNVGFDGNYRAEINYFSIDFDAYLTDDDDEDRLSRRINGTFAYRNQRTDKWILGAEGTIERNDELGLDRRLSVGGGVGRTFKRDNHQAFVGLAGVQLSQERTVEAVMGADDLLETTESWEGLLTLVFDRFRYDEPAFDLSVEFTVLPSLTTSDRVRADLDLKLKWELVEDLFLDISLYDSYDSKPVSETAEKNDYGIVASIGWEF